MRCITRSSSFLRVSKISASSPHFFSRDLASSSSEREKIAVSNQSFLLHDELEVVAGYRVFGVLDRPLFSPSW